VITFRLFPLDAQTKPNCDNPPLDICLVIDETKSIKQEDLSKVLDAAKILTSSLYRDGQNIPHFSVVSFAQDAEIRLHFNDEQNLGTLLSLLESMKTDDRDTSARIDNALQKVNEVFSGSENRPVSPKVMIIITDGKSDESQQQKLLGESESLIVSIIS